MGLTWSRFQTSTCEVLVHRIEFTVLSQAHLQAEVFVGPALSWLQVSTAQARSTKVDRPSPASVKPCEHLFCFTEAIQSIGSSIRKDFVQLARSITREDSKC